MTWNYRIVEYANGTGFGLHEVHYDKDGNAIRMTVDPAAFVGDDPTDIRGSLMMAKMDATKRPIFKEPPEWAGPSTAAQLARMERDYSAFEELSPPDVSRRTFVDWCIKAWEEKCQRGQEEDAIKADLLAACQNLTATVEELFEGLEIVASVPGRLRKAVEAAKVAIAKARKEE